MGQIIKAGPNTAHYPSYPPQADEVKAWMAGRAGAEALNKTNNIYKDWVATKFNEWKIAYDNVSVDEPPPAPPNGVDAMMSDDGFSFLYTDSKTPSGPPPPYAKRNVTPSTGSMKSVPVGIPAFGGLFFGPIGVVVDQIDGTKWQRVA